MEENTSVETVTSENTETPEILYAGKFKSASDLEAGYTELQSSFSKKLGAFEGSPEEYTRAESIAENDSLYGYAAQWGKENQLSDTKLNEFVSGYHEQVSAAQEAEQSAYQKEQLSLLGENATERITNVVDFMKANTPVSDETLESINSVMLGAEGIEVLESLVKAAKNPTPTDRPSQPTYTPEKIEEMRFAKDEFGQRKMSNPAYRANFNKIVEGMR